MKALVTSRVTFVCLLTSSCLPQVNYPGGDNSCTDGSACQHGDSTANFAYNYPNSTFQLIARRAYLASRVLDYVITLPYVIPTQIGITGHSRNGKESLIAAALDPRFTAVVESSSGSAGIASYRIAGGEGESERPASSWPGPWWLPSLKGYDGIEDTLPVDAHCVAGMIAPRALLLANALNDQVVPTFSVEASYYEAMTAYSFLNATSNLRIDYRNGDHHGYEDISRYIDWYDLAFNHSHPGTCGNACATSGPVAAGAGERSLMQSMRQARADISAPSWSASSVSGSPYDPSHWPSSSNLLHFFNWSAWNLLQPSPQPTPGPEANASERLDWLLGIPPAIGPVWDPGGSYPPASDLTYVDSLMLHDAQAANTGSAGGVVRMNAAFGNNVISGQIYFRKDMMTTAATEAPAPRTLRKSSRSQLVQSPLSSSHSASSQASSGSGTRAPPPPAGWPAVIWLHGLDYNKGIQPSYPTDSVDMMHALANASFVVLSYDQLGFGMRLQEGTQFYERHPTWSKLGAMVHDVISAVDVLSSPQNGFKPAGQPDALSAYPQIDPSRIYVAGYSIGGTVALISAAVDSRIAGVATVSGWTPFRNDTDNSRSGGIRRWWRTHATSPRLGWYAGDESNIPVEWSDILSLIAPRPVHAFVPTADRFCDINGVTSIINGLVANGYSNLTLSSPPGVNQLNSAARLDTIKWLQAAAGLDSSPI